jgi:hypothetical protein
MPPERNAVEIAIERLRARGELAMRHFGRPLVASDRRDMLRESAEEMDDWYIYFVAFLEQQRGREALVVERVLDVLRRMQVRAEQDRVVKRPPGDTLADAITAVRMEFGVTGGKCDDCGGEGCGCYVRSSKADLPQSR